MSEEAQDWRAGLPEQLQDAPFFKDAETPEQVRSNLDGAAFWQGNSILKPGADAGEEAKAKNIARLKELYPNLVDPSEEDIYSRLGKPDDHNKYSTPDNLSISEDEIINLKQIAYEASMTDKQFQTYLAGLDAARRTGAEVAKTHQEEQALALRAEWGEATDSRKLEVERFLRADENTPASVLAALDNGTISASEYKWFSALARSGDEVGEVTTHGKEANAAMTVMEATIAAAEIRDRMFKMRPTDPQYSFLQKKLLEADKAASAG